MTTKKNRKTLDDYFVAMDKLDLPPGGLLACSEGNFPALEFIPEEIWEKNRLYLKQQKIKWFQTYEEIWDFCELEDLNYRPYYKVK